MAAETGTQAIDRAAELLVSVVESTRPLGVGELATSSGLPKSTTSRLVGALERRGLVQRAGDRRVAPGPVLLRFAHRDLGASLVELALPALRTLAELSGETINLGVPTPLGVEHLAQEDSRHFVGGTNWIGRRVPYIHRLYSWSPLPIISPAETPLSCSIARFHASTFPSLSITNVGSGRKLMMSANSCRDSLICFSICLRSEIS